jgi:hypothetical protein
MTGYIAAGIILLIGIVDVWLIFTQGKHKSISAWIIRYSKKHSSLPFLIGFAMGHLFWVMDFFDYEDEKVIIERCEQYIAKHKKSVNNSR